MHPSLIYSSSIPPFCLNEIETEEMGWSRRNEQIRGAGKKKKYPCGLDRKFNINFADRCSLQGGQPEIQDTMCVSRVSWGNEAGGPSWWEKLFCLNFVSNIQFKLSFYFFHSGVLTDICFYVVYPGKCKWTFFLLHLSLAQILQIISRWLFFLSQTYWETKNSSRRAQCHSFLT